VRVVFPGVQEASRQNPSAWRSVVLGVLANHIGMARSLGLGGSELQRQLEIMHHSNRTSADFAQALARLQILVGGMGGWSRLAQAVDGGDRVRSSNDYSVMSGYAADRLPMELRGYASRYGAAHVAAVGNYLSDLGMHPHEVHRYAGYFVGSSETVRHAIRDHVRSGQAITDVHVTSAADARALMGAVQAGRVRREDLPPSVQRLMERMEREGVDPSRSDASQIQQFFDRNPNALEEARRLNAVDIGARLGRTDEDILAGVARDRARLTGQPPPLSGQQLTRGQPEPLAAATTAPQPPRQTGSTLDLG
jgi:hypothetical protein